MTAPTTDTLEARQLAAWAGFEAAGTRLQTLPRCSPERMEWILIKEACAKEHARLWGQLKARRRAAYQARHTA